MLASAAMLGGCSEVGLTEYDTDTTYIFFSASSETDSLVTSFVFYPGDRIEIPLDVTTAGRMLKDNITLKFEVDKKLSTLPEQCYEIPTDAEFRGGTEVTQSVSIVLKNDPMLKQEPRYLALRLVAGNGYKEGPIPNRLAKIYISDMISKPDWWTVLDHRGYANVAESYFVGKYSEKKYLLLLDLIGDTKFDGFNRVQLRYWSLALKRYIENWNKENAPAVLMDEENNEPMSVKVAG